jgi:prepilin-type N-terminal cleavage/methylation domain-containing protein
MKKQNAFSFVEIIIVVAIIGLLVAIAVPNFVRAKKEGLIRDGLAAAMATHGTIQPGVTEIGNNWYYFTSGTNSAFVVLNDWARSHSNLVFAAAFSANQDDYGNYAHSYAVKQIANQLGITNGYFAVFLPKQ